MTDSKSDSQLLSQVLNNAPWFHYLYHKSRDLQRLQELFSYAIDTSLAAHCQVCGIKEGKLIIMADSGVFATMLRYRAEQVLSTLQRHPEFTGVKKISVKVRNMNTVAEETPTATKEK